MAKARSPKLRTLITLHALFKHTDEDHRLNSVKLNDFLRPYGLECNKKIIMDTAEKLNKAGINVNLAGGGPYKGICLANRPLPDHALKRLIFAIDTNPYISKEQANTLLEKITPAATVFQEPMLYTTAEDFSNIPLTLQQQEKYAIIHNAISKSHRVCYNAVRMDVDKKAKALTQRLTRAETFLPRYLMPFDSKLYAIGYNHTRKRIEAVNLDDTENLRPAQYNNLPEVSVILQMLDSIDPSDYLPKESLILYEGPAVFYCGAKFLQLLYDRFGTPNGPVDRDKRCRLTYPISHVIITPEVLQWLGDLPGKGVRIIGPDPLLAAVKRYFETTKNNLTEI